MVKKGEKKRFLSFFYEISEGNFLINHGRSYY
jgi:hypothetical protein